MSDSHENIENPCGEFGPTQKWAVVWFFSVILIGIGAVYTLRNTDYYNYKTNGEFFNYSAYRENRSAATSIASDSIDPRSHADLASARGELNR